MSVETGWSALRFYLLFAGSLLLAACSGGGGSDDSGPAKPKLTLSANPTTVDANDESILSWSATNATSCTASGAWNGARPTSDDEPTGPLIQTSTYSMTCSGAGGDVTRSVTVTVTPPPAPAPIVNLSADPTRVNPNQESTLMWSSTNATTCQASDRWNGVRQPMGSESTGPLAATSTFTLECTGAGGSASKSVTVTVGSPPPAGGPAPFTRTTIDTDQAPWGKNFIDVDGDGQLDVAEGGGALGGNVFWYSYPSWTRYQIGSVGGDDDLQVGDINRDGAPDVVVNGGISWYENPRGSGGDVRQPWTRHVIDGSNNSHDLVLGDVDGDGNLDVLSRDEFGPTDLYLQTSPGSWTRVLLSAAPDGEGSALADIDRDGRVDVVGNGYWLRQPSDPINDSWVKLDIAAWPDGAAVATHDINRDGRVDVFLSASEVGIGSLAWFEAPADPINDAWNRHDIDTVEDLHRLHIVDVNQDGNEDIVFAEMHQSGTQRVGVYYNEGNGASWTLDVLETFGSHNIAVGDIEGDGDVDILGANWNLGAPDGGDLYLWRNDSTLTLSLDDWTYIQVDDSRSEQAFGLAFGDIDSDGAVDIISGRYWYRNPGGDMTAAWSRVDFGPDHDAMMLLDVELDGDLDVIAERRPSGGAVPVSWHRPNNAAGTAWTRVEIGTIPPDPADGTSQGYAVGQIVPGGSPEIVVSSAGIHYFEAPANPAAGNWPRTQITASAREEGIALADIDSDGDLDVAGFVAPAGTTVAWWENPGTGAGNWTQHDLGTTSGIEGDRLAIADINRDGRLDVVATETNLGANGNAFYWYARPADPTSANWPRTTVASNQGSLNSMDVADLDRDGLPDIVTGEHRGSLDVTVWENANEGASWTSHRVSQGRESHLGTRLVDLDRDGDLDIVSIGFDTSQFLHIWRNDAIR